MISFQLEDWEKCYQKMLWLFPLHWEEVATHKDAIKLNVWVDQYRLMNETGQLQCITARDSGSIVGYHWSIIRPHLHYKDSLTAYTDVYFLHPDYREGMNGVNLFKAAEEAWIKRGVQKAYTASKSDHDKSAIFEHLGWGKTETVYTKLLGA